MKKESMNVEEGFTLIELMTVVVVIGILAAVAIPQYPNYVARAQVSEALSLASGAKTAVAEYRNITGNWSADNGEAGLSDAGTITGNYVASVEVVNEKITAKFKPDGVNENIKDRSLVLTASDEDGAITFDCTTDLSESYAPTGCKTVANVGGPKAWDSKTSASEGKSACWDQEYADGAGGGNGWVEGDNDPRYLPGYGLSVVLKYAKDAIPACNNFVRFLANKGLNNYNTGDHTGADMGNGWWAKGGWEVHPHAGVQFVCMPFNNKDSRKAAAHAVRIDLGCK